MRRKRQRGMTLIELIVAFTIMMLLTAMAVPLARYKVPKAWIPVPEVRRSPVGKADYRWANSIAAQKVRP